MSPKSLFVDPSTIDFDKVIADLDEIRRYNPQRFEMEQLTAIVYEDAENAICVGYKDLGPDEFWIKGHIPVKPLMPGVVMLEAAAQLCNYFAQKYDALGADMIGFGGLEDVRFRGMVVPGDRLILMCKQVRSRRGKMIVCDFQGVVRGELVLAGRLKGIPIPLDRLPSR